MRLRRLLQLISRKFYLTRSPESLKTQDVEPIDLENPFPKSSRLSSRT
jgi:hypothetical protein